MGGSYSRGCGTTHESCLLTAVAMDGSELLSPHTYIYIFFWLLFRCPNDSFLMFEFL